MQSEASVSLLQLFRRSSSSPPPCCSPGSSPEPACSSETPSLASCTPLSPAHKQTHRQAHTHTHTHTHRHRQRSTHTHTHRKTLIDVIDNEPSEALVIPVLCSVVVLDMCSAQVLASSHPCFCSCAVEYLLIQSFVRLQQGMSFGLFVHSLPQLPSCCQLTTQHNTVHPVCPRNRLLCTVCSMIDTIDFETSH